MSKISIQIRRALEEFISEGDKLSIGDTESAYSGSMSTEKQYAAVCGWMASVTNLLKLLYGDNSELTNSYHKEISHQRIKIQIKNDAAYVCAACVTEILKSLLKDIDRGLVSTLENKIQAVTFDDFLEHAKFYLKSGRHDCAGVIAGVVFEDTIRKISFKYNSTPSDKSLEQHINALAKNGVITELQKRDFKVPQFVRDKATHANWAEFDFSSVSKTIEITHNLIVKHLDA
jgi:hypothetical protein